MSRLVDVDRAVELLGRGGVVAVPTDTVYGLAAAIEHPDALARLFALKDRPASVALPVLAASVAQIERLGVVWPERAQRLAQSFWPGALTIVIAVDAPWAKRVGSAGRSVGFRIPADDLLLALLARSGPLAVSSANLHGLAPCHSAADVVATFGTREELDGVVDGGERTFEVSTVVDVSAKAWRVVRLGAITTGALAALLD